MERLRSRLGAIQKRLAVCRVRAGLSRYCEISKTQVIPSALCERHLTHVSPRTPSHVQYLLGEDCSTWIVEYRTQLRPRGDHLWGSGTRTALEWAGEPQAASVVGDGSTSSTQVGNESDGNSVQKRRDGRGGDTSWERAYRGKRSECVIGSLAEGTQAFFDYS